MKRFISVILSCILMFILFFSPMLVYADNIFTYSKDAVGFVRNFFGLASDVLNEGYDFGRKIADDIIKDMNPDMGVSYDSASDTFNFPVDDSNNVVISQKFYNYCYDKAQEHIHALDGYYLYEPEYPYSFDVITNYMKDNGNIDITKYSSSNYSGFVNYFNTRNIFVLDKEAPWSFTAAFGRLQGYVHYFIDASTKLVSISNGKIYGSLGQYIIFSQDSYIDYWDSNPYASFNLDDLRRGRYVFFYNEPIKFFYSKNDVDIYLSQGKTYIPRINVSLGGLHIKPEILTNNQIETVINNVINNNHYDYSSNNEINIQNSLDTNLNLALSDLFGDGSDPVPTPTVTPGVNPTPTPGFGDGDITPTPIPGEDGEVSSWLQLIYESLSKFIESWGKYGDSIYKILLESNVKLDDIITAFDQIGSGDVSGISGNCKYDYSVLSAFLTQLWNESDKKLDTMITLLEENNEYQQKLLNSLNQIKALLVADTVMDFFKDRSNETANKAKEKFPSSIPWDIASVVNAMCAEPEDPVIRCPITISSLGIHEEIVIDLSSEEWAKLAKTCRSLLSILFILYLVHLSRELFFKGGDD